MRLIDADKLHEDIAAGSGTDLQKLFAACCVGAAPTVGNVEVVVRCKDCFYFKDFGECNRSGVECMADDFCSYGEKKGE